jgi:large subunit ribosomal protein L9
MAGYVQVILTRDVDKLGRAGDLVRVRPGHARNLLFPQGLAVDAAGENLRRVEHERRIALAQAEKLRKIAQGTAAQIEGTVIELTAQVGEENKLFGSVTARDVAEALAARGFTVDRKQLRLPEAIRTAGDHEIVAKLGHDVETRFTVRVVAG